MKSAGFRGTSTLERNDQTTRVSIIWQFYMNCYKLGSVFVLSVWNIYSCLMFFRLFCLKKNSAINEQNKFSCTALSRVYRIVGFWLNFDEGNGFLRCSTNTFMMGCLRQNLVCSFLTRLILCPFITHWALCTGSSASCPQSRAPPGW